jgi:hypothetical protein
VISHRMTGAAVAVVLVAVTAFTGTASAADYRTSDRVQTYRNAAGVIFHPLGDKFEIWDNVKDKRRVYVSWNYVGIKDGVKRVYSRGRHSQFRVNMKEFPHRIYFPITGYLEDGKKVASEIVKYPTYGP